MDDTDTSSSRSITLKDVPHVPYLHAAAQATYHVTASHTVFASNMQHQFNNSAQTLCALLEPAPSFTTFTRKHSSQPPKLPTCNISCIFIPAVFLDQLTRATLFTPTPFHTRAPYRLAILLMLCCAPSAVPLLSICTATPLTRAAWPLTPSVL